MSTDEEDLLQRRIKIQDNIVDALEAKNFWGLVDVPFRVGKSHIGVKCIDRKSKKNDLFGFKALWVTPEEKLRDIDIPETFTKEGKEHLLSSTKIVCWSSLSKVEGDFDIIIMDEYQSITTKNSANLLNGKITYRSLMGLSATPPRGFNKKLILSQLGLDRVAYMSLNDAISSQIVSDYRVTVVKFNIDNTDLKYNNFKGEPISELTRYNSLTSKIDYEREVGGDIGLLARLRMQTLYASTSRQRIIKKLVEKLKGKRGLTFTSYKEHAEKLGPHFHSTSGDNDYILFKEGIIDQLALVKSGGVGHTYTGIEYVVICQPTNDSNGLTSQSFGRGLMYKEGEPIQLYVLCCKDTVEEKWVKGTLSTLDPEKIRYIEEEDLDSLYLEYM